MVTDDAERFPFRKVAVAAFLPTVVFAIGEGAILPYVPLIAHDLGASLAVAGLVAAMVTLGELAGNVPGGALVARLGERASMIYAGLVAIVALIASFFATEWWMLLVSVLVIGLATAVFALARHAFMTTFVPFRYRARALSALGGTFRLGLFIGPLLSSLILSLGADTRATFLIFIGGCVVAVVILLLLPDPTTTFQADASREGSQLVEQESVGVFSTIRRNAKVLGTVGVGAALVSLARSGRTVLLPLWAVSIGVDHASTGLIIGIAGAVDFALFFASGYVMDRWGRLASVVPSLIGLAAGFTVLAVSHDASWAVVGFIVGAMVMSVGNGIGSGILMTLGSDLAGRESPAQFLGAWRVTTSSGGAIAPLYVSAVLAVTSITWAAAGLVAFCIAGAVVMARTLPHGPSASGQSSRGSDDPPLVDPTAL